MKFLCRIGFHDYIYTPAVYRNEQEARMGMPVLEAKRECCRCQKTQYRDEHCLGVNPPEYVYRWYNKNGRRPFNENPPAPDNIRPLIPPKAPPKPNPQAGYTDWVMRGYELYVEYGGAEKGLEIWIAEMGDEEGATKRYASFRPPA
jgi:hypothetical protein